MASLQGRGGAGCMVSVPTHLSLRTQVLRIGFSLVFPGET